MSYTSLRYHIIFSTKDRAAWLKDDMPSRLKPYISGILRNLGGECIEENGVEDHVHIIAALPPTRDVASVVRDVKSNASRWIHETFPTMAGFAWQEAYAAFSVSPSVMPALLKYVLSQQEHHAKISFLDELKWLLKGHGVAFDEQYL
jgi:REP element-mobilizing transposase RayT